MAGGIYTSTYKRQYTWPPHVPRKTASVENPTYPSLCGKGEPLCVCERPVCLCGQPRKRPPELPVCEPPDAWRYLAGVKSVYSQSYDKPVRLQPLRRRFKGPDASLGNFDPPSSDFPNPYLLGKQVFRPNLPKSKAGSCYPTGSDVSSRDVIKETSLKDLERAMQFPADLQDRIVRAKSKADKVALGRARPKGFM